MDFVIDGYNLLHAMGALSARKGPSGLEKARVRLLGILKGTFADEAPSVIVVFDANDAPPDAPPLLNYQGIGVRFARHQEADDVIEKLIAEHSAPKRLTVVSDDLRLRQAARRRHAQSMRCEAFLQFIKDRRRRQAPPPPEKTGLSSAETQQLLDEFADLDDQLRDLF